MRNVKGTRHSLRSSRKLSIIAQDPSVRVDGRIVTASIDVPAEELLSGPRGYRVAVVDYDVTANALYQPADLPSGLAGEYHDPFENAPDETLLSDPRFHAQNVYAIAMRILARFEFALGRRVQWGCEGHQLNVLPHAFAEPNAFYSRDDRSLFFGYFEGFPDKNGDTHAVFSCLSHDVIAHETTHAILDGLRSRYLEPSSPDQGAFHEGLADVVALLSVFALPDVVGAALDGASGGPLINQELLAKDKLANSVLFRLADEMGQEMSGVRGSALRHSIMLPPGKDYMDDPEWREVHKRGELLVAAMLRSFLDIWVNRLSRVGTIVDGKKDRSLVIEEGARAADHLLTMAIRAVDYCPPVDLSFSDYLSALLTVDREVVPDDRYGYRDALLSNFAAFGISPSKRADVDGSWLRCDEEMIYSRTHFDSMLRDNEEVFRFVWENRKALEIGDIGYIEVQSVRPSMRIAPDGFVLRETIAEYVQVLTVTAGELRQDFKVDVPEEIEFWRSLRLLGGGTLVFDEYGQLKYQIANHLMNDRSDKKRQGERLTYLWKQGFLDRKKDRAGYFSALHLARSGVQEKAG
ncbi:hypothetical protein B5K05_28060 [Rhizobium phaseoli]|uniref:Peptidase Gluzincin family protein n=1 Tax=Rhizobium phaseoli TaxID=396 RepID=A0ABM6CHT7_9HYPH|nr:hypothetical protein [Rhizobium phaseoli]ANL87873.1 peptidase Gluzincin family protein [Rhizobium phaseoli]ANL94382.1 peptidase Gluzincin family protein [Rhizobium phaseoli]RDJ03638.1 hypothetical protein B5K05_28060 [Rhizobium phaseoli]